MNRSEVPANFFSQSVVHLGTEQLHVVHEFIQRLEAVLERTARKCASPGAFIAYDFHLTSQAPRLIEINTNAGGAFLCLEQLTPDKRAATTKKFVDMLRAEWSCARPSLPLQTVAIVDETPLEQFLYPEFLLIQRAIEAQGLRAFICAPTDLVFRDGALFLNDERIDLLYNRLTDFYFRDPLHAHLLAATREGHTLITPAPAHHALYAHKENLVRLSDPAALKKLGASDAELELLLRVIPRTHLVTRENADSLWSQRKHYFFKPVEGFGSRGAYRGDKLTRGVWADILNGDYVAQEYVPPPTCLVNGEALKYDLRVFTYKAEILLLAARLYQGQTTNFRTPGGGFAPVVIEGNSAE